MIRIRCTPVSVCSYIKFEEDFLITHNLHPADNFREYKISDSGYSCLKDVVIALRNIVFKRYFN